MVANIVYLVGKAFLDFSQTQSARKSFRHWIWRWGLVLPCCSIAIWRKTVDEFDIQELNKLLHI